MSQLTAENRVLHWQHTRNLMTVHLTVWFFFSYVVHWFAPELNTISFAGWPLGYYMASQGALIAFVIQLFIFVKQQDNVDRKFGVAEDD